MDAVIEVIRLRRISTVQLYSLLQKKNISGKDNEMEWSDRLYYLATMATMYNGYNRQGIS